MKLLANFKYGANGALVTTSDGGLGQTRFDAVTVNGSVSPIYDTGTTHLGDPSLTVDADAGAVSSYVEWFAKVGAQTDVFGRGYFRFAALPGGNTDLIRCTSTSGGGGNQLIIQVTSTGKIRVVAASAAAVTTTASISTGAFFRIEFESVAGATATQTVKLFNTVESTTPTETLTPAASSGFATIDKTRWGQVTGTASAVYKMAHMEFNNTGYPGPYTVSAGGGTWYVSKNGNNADGRSWATAWNELDQIDYAQVAPGDTVLIDGGATRYVSSDDFGYDFVSHATNRPGLTSGMMYTSPWVVQGSGSSGSPITFTTSEEAGHNGTVVVYGGRHDLLPEANSTTYDVAGNQGRQIGIDVAGVHDITFAGRHRSQFMVYGVGVGAADTSLLAGNGCGIRFNSTSSNIYVTNFEIFDCGNFGKWNRPSDSAAVFKTDQEGISLFSGTGVVIDRCLIHDCGQDSIQGGPANGLTLKNSWLYFRRAHSTWTGFGFNAGSQGVPDQNTTHVDGIQLYAGGLRLGPVTVDHCISGPMVNQGFYFGDGNLTSYDNVSITNSLVLLPFAHGIQGDVGDSVGGASSTTPEAWVIDHCTIHAASTARPSLGAWRPIEIEGGRGHIVTNTIVTWGGTFYQTSPTNWNTGACSGNVYSGGGDALPGGTNVDPLFVNAIGATNNTPTFAQAVALDLTPQAPAAVSAGADIHSIRDLLDRIDTLNGDVTPVTAGGTEVSLPEDMDSKRVPATFRS